MFGIVADTIDEPAWIPKLEFAREARQENANRTQMSQINADYPESEPSSLSAAVRNYGDVFRSDRFPNPVIPAKAGIQNVWIPATATSSLDARLRGHDVWNA